MRKGFLVSCLCILGSCVGAQNKLMLDSLHGEFTKANSDSARAFLLGEISYQWCGINFDSSFYYARQSHRLAQRSGNTSMITLATVSLGLVYDYEYRFDSAIYYYKKALKMSRDNEDQHREAITLFNIGVTFYFKGDLDSALHFYLKAEPVFKALDDRQNLSRLYNNLGRIYEKTKQYQYAIEVSRISVAIKKQLRDTKGLLNTYTNLSSIYQQLNQYDSALYYSEKCIELAKSSGDLSAYKGELTNLGIIYKNMDQPEKALDIFREAGSLIEPDDDPYYLSQVYHNLSVFYFQQNDWTNTHRYLDKTSDHLLEDEYVETAMHHYHLDFAFNEKSGKTDDALRSLKKYMELRDEYLTQETMRRTTELEQL